MDAIDISYAQGVVNWAVLSKAGLKAVFPRIGYGEILDPRGGIIDDQFKANAQNGLAFGQALGGYLYSYAKNADEARMEAEFCLWILKDYGPGQFPYPICIDCEDEKWQGDVDINPIIIAFCDTILQNGYKTGYYVSLDWFERKVSAEVKSRYDLWLAQWNSNHAVPCQIWQFSNAETVPGIGGRVDGNMILKDYGGGVIYAPVEIPPVLEPVYSESVFSVLELQRTLRLLNFGPDLDLDGVFGPNTEAAVMVAQRGYGIDADGVPGKITEHYLKSQLRTVQNRLNEIGGYGIEVDGRLGDHGNETILALQNFQFKNGLTPDWIIGVKTYDILFNGGVGNSISPPPVTPVTNDPPATISGQLTEHFHKDEFACDCGGSYCNGFPVEINMTLVSKMEQVRQILGLPIHITSGVRCEIRNAEVGGIPYSKHKQGLACDFYTPGMSSARVSELAAIARSVGLVTYEYPDQLFVHAEI